MTEAKRNETRSVAMRSLPPRRVVRPTDPFTPADQQAVDAILERNGRDPAALLAILQDVQDVAKYLPRTWLSYVANTLGLPETRIYRMATFFRALSLKPRGEHVCTVCLGTACHVRGAPRLVEKVERDFALCAGETTKDMKFTLETVNCVGACALGPLVILDGQYHGNITSAKLDKVLKPIREGA
jgi:NADH-quinone oxidoreductase subunit E